MSSYRDEARRAFESSAARIQQTEFLKRIQTRHPALEGFASVEVLLELLRDPGGTVEGKNAVLVALLEEHQSSSAGAAFALLAAAMFPALDRIYRSRLYGTDDPDELWGCVVQGFAEALDRYPTARRRARVAANIECETMAAIRRANLRDRRSTQALERFVSATAPFLTEIEAVDPDVPKGQTLSMGDFVEPGHEPAVEPDVAEFKEAGAAAAPLFDAVAISEEDRFLVLGVHLYDRPLGELAAELGISREAAKKRHLRAIRRLRAVVSPAEPEK
jgi:DNA-directed RNA polymerase specialized sigma24 family protein